MGCFVEGDGAYTDLNMVAKMLNTIEGQIALAREFNSERKFNRARHVLAGVSSQRLRLKSYIERLGYPIADWDFEALRTAAE
ncbi:hypothetical protein [Pelagibacterium lentulum]|uniref:Uncharacterized protein n=1 Tax=Pelagibacterium lentulum TaxID=2029865 RepID=A0A916RAE6_9HYPH|nr:hypothetical protein [Pelagibacterium lentulum]GGA45945.1 hypothetical protein GCM10011499_14610 [Pelagibacterium lentulum]